VLIWRMSKSNFGAERPMVHPNPFVLLCFWTVRAVAAVAIGIAATGAGRAQTVSPPVWTVPEVGALPDDDHGRLDKALDTVQAMGWTVVDMKNDWKKIFPFRSK